MKKYSKEEVVELFKNFKSICNSGFGRNGYKFEVDDMLDFLKEKGLVEKFEKDKWYKCDSGIYEGLVCYQENNIKGNVGYGLGYVEHKWLDEIIMHNPTEATDKEVGEALVNEAKNQKHIYEYYKWEDGELRGSNNNIRWYFIFANGKWDEIIEEEETIKFEITSIKNNDGKIEVVINGETYIKK